MTTPNQKKKALAEENTRHRVYSVEHAKINDIIDFIRNTEPDWDLDKQDALTHFTERIAHELADMIDRYKIIHKAKDPSEHKLFKALERYIARRLEDRE